MAKVAVAMGRSTDLRTSSSRFELRAPGGLAKCWSIACLLHVLGGALRDLSHASGERAPKHSSPHFFAQVFGARLRFPSQGVEEKLAMDGDVASQVLPQYVGAARPATQFVLPAVLHLPRDVPTISVRRRAGGYCMEVRRALVYKTMT